MESRQEAETPPDRKASRWSDFCTPTLLVLGLFAALKAPTRERELFDSKPSLRDPVPASSDSSYLSDDSGITTDTSDSVDIPPKREDARIHLQTKPPHAGRREGSPRVAPSTDSSAHLDEASSFGISGGFLEGESTSVVEEIVLDYSSIPTFRDPDLSLLRVPQELKKDTKEDIN